MENKVVKCIIIILGVVSIGLGIIYINVDKKDIKKENNNSESNSNLLKELPKPEITGGTRGELGIDKNINEQNIDEYLDRSDAVYRDMRMLEDPATYENIGGDRFLSGYIKGFEVVPLPYIIPVEGLPKEVGKTYGGKTLFSYENNTYVANYEESMSIIEELFPKDKVIFLMCGGGGYAGMTKNFLVQLGWNPDKIYNIGGYWYYEGKNKVEVKKIINDKVVYDYDSVPYHKIEFNKLTEIDKRVELSSEFYNYDETKVKDGSIIDYYSSINVDIGEWKGYDPCTPGGHRTADYCESDRTSSKEESDKNTAKKKKAEIINQLLKEKKSFIAVVDSTYVCDDDPDTKDVSHFAKKYFYEKNIYIFKMGLDILKKSDLYKNIKYSPTVIIVKEGEIYKYTDPNSDEFKTINKNYNQMVKWLEDNVKIK